MMVVLFLGVVCVCGGGERRWQQDSTTVCKDTNVCKDMVNETGHGKLCGHVRAATKARVVVCDDRVQSSL